MAAIVTLSLAWALYETATSPTWAYFSTFSRVWELGVGALLATVVAAFVQIPRRIKPVLSWLGLCLIAVSLFGLNEDSMGFPAPWALVPVVGAGLVIVAGVDGEPGYLWPLRNPLSGYLGDISYSLYLVHWPVIVVLGSLMVTGLSFSVVAVALTLALSIASYHFVEQPLRRADLVKLRAVIHEVRRRRYRMQQTSVYAALAALVLLAVASVAYVERPGAFEATSVPPLAVAAPAENDPFIAQPEWDGPEASALQQEIVQALRATRWPALTPSMESVISEPQAASKEVAYCGGAVFADASRCTWGSASADRRVLVVGNSIAMGYVGPLKDIAIDSGGRVQVRSEAMTGCNFVYDLIENADESFVNACPARKQRAIDFINSDRPEVVIISNNYTPKRVAGTSHILTPGEWARSMRQLVDQFRQNVETLVFLAPPPGDVVIAECYGKRSSSPAECIGSVGSYWLSMAEAERDLAESVGAVWIDSRPWFCSGSGLCPSFVGLTPTKFDAAHMTQAYGAKIRPVIAESLEAAGVA